MSETFVTREELATEMRALREEMAQLRSDLNAAVALLTERMDRLERSMNRFMFVFGTTQVILVVLVILVLRRIGL